MKKIRIIIAWLVGELRLVDFALKRADHWIGAIALIVALLGFATL